MHKIAIALAVLALIAAGVLYYDQTGSVWKVAFSMVINALMCGVIYWRLTRKDNSNAQSPRQTDEPADGDRD